LPPEIVAISLLRLSLLAFQKEKGRRPRTLTTAHRMIL